MNNEGKIVGVINKITFEEVRGKKNPEAVYPKYVFRIEVADERDMSKKGRKGYKKVTEFPDLESFGADYSNFAVGDPVAIDYILTGQDYTRKSDGSVGHMTKAVITYMKYGDLDAGYPSHKGKITIDSPIDPKGEREEFDRVFTGPKEDDEEFKDLPFMLALLMGLGTLFLL